MTTFRWLHEKSDEICKDTSQNIKTIGIHEESQKIFEIDERRKTLICLHYNNVNFVKIHENNCKFLRISDKIIKIVGIHEKSQ